MAKRNDVSLQELIDVAKEIGITFIVPKGEQAPPKKASWPAWIPRPRLPKPLHFIQRR